MLGSHDRAALQFSGGKDSLALLHMARPHLDRITVYFADTGAIYPHVVDFVEKTCRDLGARLVTVHPSIDVLSYHEKEGLPVDVLPIDTSPELRQVMPDYDGPRLQSWLTCCTRMLWLPMMDAIRRDQHTLVLRGSKRRDPHVTAGPGTIDGGIEYDSPLWDWTDEEVLRYLDAKGVAMPAQYPEILDSMDCWCCTALLTGKYAKSKLGFARAYYPDLWPFMKARLRVTQDIVSEHASKTARLVDEVTHG